MEDIQSRQNAKIKEIRSLRQRKQRKAKKLFVVEGIRHIGEALDANANIEYLLYAPELLKGDFAISLISLAEGKGISAFSTTAEIMESLSEKENPQGLLAVLKQNTENLANFSADNHPWFVALVSPQDPGNLGTVLRTIDAVGADGLILLDNSVDIFHPSAVRASMGALFWKPVITASYEEFVAWSSKNKYSIYGTSAKGNTLFNKVAYQSPAILLFGSERQGLTEEQVNFCDQLLKLPMSGSASSLNLAVSSGIFLYEMYSHFKSD